MSYRSCIIILRYLCDKGDGFLGDQFQRQHKTSCMVWHLPYILFKGSEHERNCVSSHTKHYMKPSTSSVQLGAIKYQELIALSNYGILVHQWILNILYVRLLRSFTCQSNSQVSLANGDCWKMTKTLTMVNL